MSNLALDFAELPKVLRDRMFADFGDHVVSDLLVGVRGKSLSSPCSTPFLKVNVSLLRTQAIEFRALASKAAVSITVESGFSEVRPQDYV